MIEGAEGRAGDENTAGGSGEGMVGCNGRSLPQANSSPSKRAFNALSRTGK